MGIHLTRKEQERACRVGGAFAPAASRNPGRAAKGGIEGLDNYIELKTIHFV